MEKIKIAVFGSKNTTRYLLNSLIEKLDISLIVTVSPELNEIHNIPDYTDLSDFSKSHGITLYQCKNYTLKNEDDKNFINSKKLDIAFVIGWQRLIPKQILSNARIGFFGMHGSSENLPKGRGRSPLNWSIIEGRKHFYTNLFKYNPGIDDGDIVDKVKFQISNTDDAKTLHFKNMVSMRYLIEKNLDSLMGNMLNLKNQPNLIPTYYPKRTPSDSLINWELDIHKLERFIRAVTKPFNGAFTFIEDKKIIVLKAQIFDFFDFDYDDKPLGSILEVFDNKCFLVKCNGGLLLVTDYQGEKSLIKQNIIFHNNKLSSQDFKINKNGFYDI